MKIRRVETMYNTRVLVAGTANVSDALGRALVRMGKYEEVTQENAPKPAEQTHDEPEPTDHLEMLRDKARELGIHVDRRWGIARLQDAIASQRKE